MWFGLGSTLTLSPQEHRSAPGFGNQLMYVCDWHLNVHVNKVAIYVRPRLV